MCYNKTWSFSSSRRPFRLCCRVLHSYCQLFLFVPFTVANPPYVRPTLPFCWSSHSLLRSMGVEGISKRFAAVLLLLFSQTWCINAQTTSAGQSPSVAATTSYSPYPTTPGSAGGTYAGDTTFLGSGPTDAAGENAAGASGGQGGSVNLSMGAIIAIVVVVAMVVLLGGMFPSFHSDLMQIANS